MYNTFYIFHLYRTLGHTFAKRLSIVYSSTISCVCANIALLTVERTVYAKTLLAVKFLALPFFKKGNEKPITQANYIRRTPDEGSPSFFALQRNSPSPAFGERYKGLLAPLPSPPFEKGGRKLFYFGLCEQGAHNRRAQDVR